VVTTAPPTLREAILETDGSVSVIPRTAPAPEPGETGYELVTVILSM
jgi:uncharacterized membrane protein YcaP (DUF421 family)